MIRCIIHFIMNMMIRKNTENQRIVLNWSKNNQQLTMCITRLPLLSPPFFLFQLFRASCCKIHLKRNETKKLTYCSWSFTLEINFESDSRRQGIVIYLGVSVFVFLCMCIELNNEKGLFKKLFHEPLSFKSKMQMHSVFFWKIPASISLQWWSMIWVAMFVVWIHFWRKMVTKMLILVLLA